MGKFSYSAIDGNGKRSGGILDAENEQEVFEQLRKMGMSPLSVSVADGRAPNSPFSFGKFTLLPERSPNLSEFFEEVHMLLDAGIRVEKALQSMTKGGARQEQKVLASRIHQRLLTGENLANAMAESHPFPKQFIALIGVAEATGELAPIFGIIAKKEEETQRRRRELKDALLYPSFLMILFVCAFAFILFVLVPSLKPLFETTGQAPPLLISGLSQLREGLLEYGWIFVVFIALGLVLAMTGSGRKAVTYWLDRLSFRLPIIEVVRTKMIVADYLGSLAILMRNNINVVQALVLAGESCGSRIFDPKLRVIADEVSSGVVFYDAFEQAGLFDERVLSLLQVADNANAISMVCDKASSILHSEVNRTVSKALAAITPTVTILLGVLIGGLVLTVMTSILSLNDLAV